MSFRNTNQRYLAPAAQGLMIFGIVSLCQPWSLFFHRFGLTISLIGLAAFIVVSHIGAEPEAEYEDEEDFV